MDVKDFDALSENQKKYIEEEIEAALDSLKGMRGDNDRGASSIHAYLNDTISDLAELQEYTWTDLSG